ncbi:MAG TPA: hypothetical protein VE442_05640 [Jatrophihabitans sp.]|jgi:hypothetical protein|nr:hypothetical protein [Jatrophihabitans sp.]
MTARVFLPTGLDNSVRVGGTAVIFRVGHIAGARRTAVTSAALSVSVDGVHFTRLPATNVGHGRYRATLITPTSLRGKAVSVRVTGTDAVGGSITKTVSHAYVVAPR